MEWTTALDGYCERLGPGLWAEPVNALSNAGFLIAAAVLWPRLRGPGLGPARGLTGLLALIGVGSALFHTTAQLWSMWADVLPIGAFILAYLFAANRYFLGLSRTRAALLTAGFVPYAAVAVPVFQALPFFGISAAYWPVPLLIGLYAVLLRRRLPQVARGLGAGAGLLTLSLILRSLDAPLCGVWPTGTHFAWHLLNAAMLGWMIELLRRHLVATQRPLR